MILNDRTLMIRSYLLHLHHLHHLYTSSRSSTSSTSYTSSNSQAILPIQRTLLALAWCACSRRPPDAWAPTPAAPLRWPCHLRRARRLRSCPEELGSPGCLTETLQNALQARCNGQLGDFRRISQCATRHNTTTYKKSSLSQVQLLSQGSLEPIGKLFLQFSLC